MGFAEEALVVETTGIRGRVDHPINRAQALASRDGWYLAGEQTTFAEGGSVNGFAARRYCASPESFSRHGGYASQQARIASRQSDIRNSTAPEERRNWRAIHVAHIRNV